MPTAIISGLPVESDRRVQSALKQGIAFPDAWRVVWMRSKGRVPGLAPSQLDDAKLIASDSGGAHLLIFRGREKREEDLVIAEIRPYFRVRWLDGLLLKSIPHSMDTFFDEINRILDEESEWIATVKPSDESSCLLLPQCAFLANTAVRHIWGAADESGIVRIKMAAQACQRFNLMHWISGKGGARNWIDGDGRIFDHRGARHGIAPFPRFWKYSYQIGTGFHYDVTSREARSFHIDDARNTRHSVSGIGHLNIDAHGYVRR